ncbi:hypothetical protein FRC18_010662 [Serendipita sp. 400]|nr:hypothetical protein FRC18_010662 [Serendipita sp. 400]
MSTTSLETTTTLSSLTSSSPNTGSTLPTTSAPVTTPAPSLEVPTSALNRPEVIAALIGASVLVLVLFLFCVVILCRYRRRRRDLLSQTPPSNESHDLLPDDMRERDIPPSQDRRFDIENPAPAHLGKANGIPLFPHLKTLQLLTRTTSVVSSASTLVSRPSTSNSKENPEIHIERAYTLQPPIADHNSNYLSDKELGKKRGRDSVSTEAYETIMYSQRSPQWDNSVAKRFSTASTIRFARFSRGWGLRSSAMSSDRVTVFDEVHKARVAQSLPQCFVEHPKWHLGVEGDRWHTRNYPLRNHPNQMRSNSLPPKRYQKRLHIKRRHLLRLPFE